jgi:hypothetical protein
VRFNLPVNAHTIFESSVGFRNNGREAPASIDFDFLDEVDAIGVIGGVQ